MPAVNITTTAAKAFDVPEGKWGFVLRNNSDTTLYIRLSKNVATSGDNMGMPLDPGAEKTFCFAERNRGSIALMAIHGGSGDKQLVYDILDQQVQATFGGGQSTTLIAGDVQIGAVELKNGSDDTRAVVGAGSGLSSSSNALAVGGQIGGHTKTVEVTFSLDTSAYAAGDLLAESQVIAACMRLDDKQGVLSGFSLHDEDDQGIELDVVFLSANVSLGSENSAVSITDANAREILGIVNVASSDWKDLGGVRVATKLNVNVPIKPVAGTDDCYVALITRGTPTHTGSGIRGRFHFLQD